MRILLLLNGPRERYVVGADTARRIKWREYCSPATELEMDISRARRKMEAAPRCTRLEPRMR